MKKPSCSAPRVCGSQLSASAPLLLTLVSPCKQYKFLHFWNSQIIFYVSILWENFHAWLTLFTFSPSDTNCSDFMGASDSAEKVSLSLHNEVFQSSQKCQEWTGSYLVMAAKKPLKSNGNWNIPTNLSILSKIFSFIEAEEN